MALRENYIINDEALSRTESREKARGDLISRIESGCIPSTQACVSSDRQENGTSYLLVQVNGSSTSIRMDIASRNAALHAGLPANLPAFYENGTLLAVKIQ